MPWSILHSLVLFQQYNISHKNGQAKWYETKPNNAHCATWRETLFIGLGIMSGCVYLVLKCGNNPSLPTPPIPLASCTICCAIRFDFKSLVPTCSALPMLRSGKETWGMNVLLPLFAFNGWCICIPSMSPLKGRIAPAYLMLCPRRSLPPLPGCLSFI